jgi:hypothetical protein
MNDPESRFDIIDGCALASTLGGFSTDDLQSFAQRTDWSAAHREGMKVASDLSSKGGVYGALMGAGATVETGPGVIAGAYAGYLTGTKAGFGLGYLAGAGHNVWNQWHS